MNADWRARYEVAIEAAGKAAEIALGYFPDGHDAEFQQHVELKLDRSPVTPADRAAESYLRNRLGNAFPDDTLLGEEYGEKPGGSGYRWLLDPVDGTRSFARGIPLWGTLVGLEYRGEQVLGVGVMPALSRTYRAMRGGGAFVNDRPLHVSTISDLGDAMLCCATLSGFIRAGRDLQFLELARRTQRQRAYGNFYGFALVAEGSAEIMVEYGVHPWDVAALVPILEEAGGRFTDWRGHPTIESPDVLATNGRLHDATLRILTG